MEQVPSPTFAQKIWKKVIRCGINLLGLLILRAMLGALPMLKNASAFGDTLMSPLVLAYAIVDTVLLLAILDFGIAIGRDLQERYEQVPELRRLVNLGTLVIVLIFAYKLYETPTACLVIQRGDLISLGTNTQAPLGDVLRAWSQTVNQLNAAAMENATGDALASYQQLAVAVLRKPPSLYPWIFLALIAIPAVSMVAVISRHLNTFSDLLSSAGGALTGAAKRLATEVNRAAAVKAEKSVQDGLPGELIDKIAKLKSLLDSGAISKEDFEVQKTNVFQRPISRGKSVGAEDLHRLKQLFESGALTEEEYGSFKTRLLELV